MSTDNSSKYVSREWPTNMISVCRNQETWSFDDKDTVLHVLDVLEGKIKSAPDISLQQLQTAKIRIIGTAMREYQKSLESLIADDEKWYRTCADANNSLLAGFYKGRICAQKEFLSWMGEMIYGSGLSQA